SATGWHGYENATIIDFLATPGPLNTVNDTATPLTSEMLRNAASSGISAVNVSVDEGTYEDTFKTIAYWEHEIGSHPDALMRIRRFSDIAIAKQNRKLGLIYGFQGTSMIGNDLDRLNTFSSFGVKVIQLTYNRRVLIGDGCLEPANAG